MFVLLQKEIGRHHFHFCSDWNNQNYHWFLHRCCVGALPTHVFSLSPQYYNDFGDIIKETMCRTRQMDKIQSARTLVLCLQQVQSLHTQRASAATWKRPATRFFFFPQLFTRLKREQESGGRSHPGVQTFTCIKELARRFALTFGDLVKFRECVVMIHRSAQLVSHDLDGFFLRVCASNFDCSCVIMCRNGIEFVFQEFSQTPETLTPPYLSYLTILSEFSSKLLKPDKKTVWVSTFPNRFLSIWFLAFCKRVPVCSGSPTCRNTQQSTLLTSGKRAGSRLSTIGLPYWLWLRGRTPCPMLALTGSYTCPIARLSPNKNWKVRAAQQQNAPNVYVLVVSKYICTRCTTCLRLTR